MRLLSIFTLVFLSLNAYAEELVWTKESYEKDCIKNSDKIIQKVDSDRVHLECRRRGKEVSSAWFDKKSMKMAGWLNRIRNSDGILVKDQEFQENGKIKEQGYYIRTLGKPHEQIQNLFVFNEKNELVRGTVTVNDGTFVVAAPGLVLYNGNPSSQEELNKKLSSYFKQSNNKSIYSLVGNIWSSQNTPKQESRGNSTGNCKR